MMKLEQNYFLFGVKNANVEINAEKKLKCIKNTDIRKCVEKNIRTVNCAVAFNMYKL